MAITINGTTGLSGVDGSAGTPALQGTDSNTGISFGTDEVNINTGGSTRATVDSSGRLGIATTTPGSLDAFGDDIVIGDGSGHRGATIYSGTGSQGVIYFADGTSGGDVARGKVFYSHSDNYLAFDTDATERMRIDSSGNLRFNSGYGSVATAYGCRAWVNFNGTGTVSIRASGNVSSITDSGTGKYRANFTNSMPDAYYAAEVTVIKDDAADNNDMYATIGATGVSGRTPTTTYVPITTTRLNTALVDCPVVNVVIIR